MMCWCCNYVEVTHPATLCSTSAMVPLRLTSNTSYFHDAFIFVAQPSPGVDDEFLLHLLLIFSTLYPFNIAARRFKLAPKKRTDAIQTCRCDSQPNISNVKAEPNQVRIDSNSRLNDTNIRREDHWIRSEQSGKRHRYQVKYCAVMTLLNATKQNV